MYHCWMGHSNELPRTSDKVNAEDGGWDKMGLFFLAKAFVGMLPMLPSPKPIERTMHRHRMSKKLVELQLEKVTLSSRL
jgi:hypothetical protein